MADSCTGLQHQAGKTANRDVSPNAVLVDHDEGAVEHIDIALFDEDDRRAILQRKWPRRRQAGKRDAAHGAGRRRSISPRPNALPRPKPRAILARKMSGSRTVSIPSNSMAVSLTEP